MARSAMKCRREEKPDARLADAGRNHIGRNACVYAQSFEHVRTAALAGYGAVAVLRHAHTGARHHECRNRRDVESRSPVATRPACIEQRTIGRADRHRQRRGSHGARKSGKFGHRFAAHPQRRQERRGEHRCRFSGEQRPHGGFSLGLGKNSAIDDGVEQVKRHVRVENPG